MRETVISSPPNVQWLFESHLPRRMESHPELLRGVECSFRFVIQGEEAGTWLVELREGQSKVVPEGSGGQCTVTVSAGTLIDIACCRVNPRVAWEDGRLRADGEFRPTLLATLLQLLQIRGEEAPAAAASAAVDRTESSPNYPRSSLAPATSGELVLSTALERPDLLPMANTIIACSMPEFMLHSAIGHLYWKEIYTTFPDFQFMLHDAVSGEVVATGVSAALAWDSDVDGWPEDGWDWALARIVGDHGAGRTPNVQCGLLIAIAPNHQGKSLSMKMIKAMKAIGQRHRLDMLMLPVRPTLKSRYPLIPIDRYMTWRRGDGSLFDPWLRVHHSIGAEIIRPCSRSALIEGSVSEWEAWTDLQFPGSGSYIVPGALVPVEIDRTLDRGVYLEPNVWMRHTLEA